MVSLAIDFDMVFFGPLAPILGMFIFWLVQLLFIENQKHLLAKLKFAHEPLVRFTNFVGVLFQTICHALGYTVTRSGIQHFHVTVNYGSVEPKKEKTGVFEWISNSFLFLGPFLIPSGLLLLCSYFLLEKGFAVSAPVSYSFVEGLTIFGTALSTYAEGFGTFLLHIDLFNPAHLGFLLLLLFLGMGIRPSYMGEEKKEKINMMYDLKNIKNHLIQHPWYLLLLFVIAYGLFCLFYLLSNNWYYVLFAVFGWISLLAIIALLLAYLLLALIKLTDDIATPWRYVPFLTLPLSYILLRGIFMVVPLENDTTIALAGMILCTLGMHIIPMAATRTIPAFMALLQAVWRTMPFMT